MVYSSYLTPTALNDIDSAVNYYNDKVTDLGFRFADEVDISLQAIALQPNAYTERYKEVRGKLVKKFPYLILYRTNNSTQYVEVLRIFNTSLNPYWA